MNNRLTIPAVVVALGLAAVLSVFFFARSGSDRDAASTTGEASKVQQIPKPAGKVVLAVKGVASGNSGAHLTKLDLRTIKSLPSVTLRVDEPFVKTKMSFTGVRLSELLAVTGVPRSSGRIYMHALDDYHVTFSRQDLVSSGALLATSADGAAMSLKEGGPIRVVFPGDSRVAGNTDNWIWSLDRIVASR